MNFAVIGAGNGGQAISGYLGMMGYSVNLYDRDANKIDLLVNQGGVFLDGRIKGFGKINCATNNLLKAVEGVDIIMITTIANVHYQIAQQLSPFLSDGQIIILSPGRTGGALSFRSGLVESCCDKHIYIAEAQTLVYACRSYSVGTVNIIGVKDNVLLAALPSSDIDFILHKIQQVYPCFTPTTNILCTSLGNIGAMFHPCIVLFNAATIERGNPFYFYRDMSPSIAKYIERFDQERLDLGRAYGIDLLGVNDWISYAYKETRGDSLCEKMKNNPAYYDILAPSSIFARQILEDIPTGIIPMMELGKVAGLPMSLFESIAHICSGLLGLDFFAEGRTLKYLGLDGLSKEEIINYIK